ncbi:T-box transcription factor TBX3 [Nilaparvata lugens]|uniref:T-box transcription factor TBX3 n=1 Tax=Nilaparvata lugens TaxID=108931 RepID=UPI00193E5234|nr:T-box transcription factor TBX3 [Nilaparvata lugens]
MCDQMCNPAMSGAEMKLHNKDIWNQFHEHTTEMIITKSGRRMFPYLRLEAAGLDPEARYFVLLELNLSSSKRYKFNGAQWTPIGNAEPQLPPSSRLYIHPDSPALGRHWMSQSILFNKVKLTNHTLDRSGNIVLTSMHKYMPTIHLVMASDVLAVHWSPTTSFRFKETEFVAVTAYQNERITKLKIDNNPFAKGFRETGQSRLKRRMQQAKDKEDEVHDMKKRSSPMSVTPTPDSGISSIGSPAERCSLSDEDTKNNMALLSCPEDSYDKHHMFSNNMIGRFSSPPPTSFTTSQHQIHSPWMDLPLPPYPMIPPYCPSVSSFPPTLWPYPPFLLPRSMIPTSENSSFSSSLSPSSSLSLSPSSSFSSPPLSHPFPSHKFFLPPHLIPYLPPTIPPPVSEPCLIDLSVRK